VLFFGPWFESIHNDEKVPVPVAAGILCAKVIHDVRAALS
jgi:hypothetical protein